MKKLMTAVLPLLILAGCVVQTQVDTTPPPIPQGIRTVSLDNAIEISWLPSEAGDLSGYHIWRGASQAGRFVEIGTVNQSPFVDDGVVNGTTYYYAISAFDRSGNESDLSSELVYDTPRPEGYSVQLTEATTAPAYSGYDFSSYAVTPFNDTVTDVFFENLNGRLSLSVWSDTDIQDMGYTSNLDEITVAPTHGWSPTGSAEAITGHTYVVWTWDDHYAKIRITGVNSSAVTFDWAYQTAPGNIELKRAPDRGGKRSPLSRTNVAMSN